MDSTIERSRSSCVLHDAGVSFMLIVEDTHGVMVLVTVKAHAFTP